MPIIPNRHVINPDSLPGFDRDLLPGDPVVLQQIVDDFAYLRDVAWSVYQGLQLFLASASAGGFQGATADEFRNVISGRLATFLCNIARAFSLAGEAVAEYKLALVAAQQAVFDVVAQAQGMAARDVRLGQLRQQVQGRRSAVVDAEQAMIQALRDAADMVSEPVRMPSLWDKVWMGIEKALGIAVMVLSLVSLVVDGPWGALAFAGGVALWGMSAVDLAQHRTNLTGFLLGALGLLAPETKGLFTLEQVGAAFRGMVAGAGRAAGDLGRVLSSPGAAAFVMTAAARTAQGLARVPGVVVRGLGSAGRALPAQVTSAPRFIGEALAGLGGVIADDFAQVTARYPRLAAAVEAHTAYGLVTVGRGLGALLTPMRFTEMAELGFGGAWAVWRERASWSGAMRALGAGWTGYGVRAGRAGMAMLDLLHGLQANRWSSTAERPPGLLIPGPMAFGRGVGAPAEPLPGPVTSWTVPDLRSTAGFTADRHPMVVPPAAGSVKGPDHLGTPATTRLWLPNHTNQARDFQAIGQLGGAPPQRSEHPGLMDAPFGPTPPIMRDKYAHDAHTGLINTRAGLLAPITGVPRPGGERFVHQLGTQGAEQLPHATVETMAGPERETVEGVAIKVGDTPQLPHTAVSGNEPVTSGVLPVLPRTSRTPQAIPGTVGPVEGLGGQSAVGRPAQRGNPVRRGWCSPVAGCTAYHSRWVPGAWSSVGQGPRRCRAGMRTPR